MRRTVTILLGLWLASAAGAAPAESTRREGPEPVRILRERANLPAAVIESGSGTFPSPELLFSMVGADNAPTVRALPDVTGDGVAEVLVGIDESGTDNLFCLDGTSAGASPTVVWSLETMDGVSGGSPWSEESLSVGSDQDDDGSPNLYFGTAWGGRTAYSINGDDGEIVWRFDTYDSPDSGWIYSLAEIGDVTGDGVPETAFASGSDSDRLYLVDGASSGEPATIVWTYLAADAVGSVRNLGDADDDGFDDVVAAVWDNGDLVVALSGATTAPGGDVLWTRPIGLTPQSLGVIPDLDGDGVDEVLAAVWATDGSSVRCLDGESGNEVWRTTTVGGPGMAVDLLDDITGDGVPEVIVSSWDNAVTVVDGSDGSQVWKTFVGTTNGGDVWTARAIGDLDGDGQEDVVAGSFDYHVYAMSGDDGDILWAYFTANRVFSVHPIDDLDGDGAPDVVAGTQDTQNNVVLHVLSGGAGPIFVDGFESGDTSAWPSTVP